MVCPAVTGAHASSSSFTVQRWARIHVHCWSFSLPLALQGIHISTTHPVVSNALTRTRLQGRYCHHNDDDLRAHTITTFASPTIAKGFKALSTLQCHSSIVSPPVSPRFSGRCTRHISRR